MSKTHRLLVLLGVLCLAGAWAPAAAQVTVSGTVVDAETGEPLADASAVSRHRTAR